MTLKPPSGPGGVRLFDNPHAALEYELAHEKASALGRMGRALEAALAALTAFDREHGVREALTDDLRSARRTLVADAGVALWHFIVQREALGLRDGARVLRDYGVPNEVRDRMGLFPAEPRPRRRP